MIVAISLERYCAVHYPVDYRQVSNFGFNFLSFMTLRISTVMLLYTLTLDVI